MKHPVAQMHNSVSSYEHMQGSPRRAHEGSQSNHPAPEKGKNAGIGGGKSDSRPSATGHKESVMPTSAEGDGL